MIVPTYTTHWTRRGWSLASAKDSSSVICAPSSPEFFFFFVGILIPLILLGELISVFLFCHNRPSSNISMSLGPLITGSSKPFAAEGFYFHMYTLLIWSRAPPVALKLKLDSTVCTWLGEGAFGLTFGTLSEVPPPPWLLSFPHYPRGSFSALLYLDFVTTDHHVSTVPGTLVKHYMKVYPPHLFQLELDKNSPSDLYIHNKSGNTLKARTR
jgi:hypothetical protein